jgi:Raf kinase inhibitor-like YbhB/YbcL family protein
MTLTSTAFADQATIPDAYTCKGAGTSPPLAWTAGPSPQTKSYAIVMLDKALAAPNNVHWVIFDMPAGTTGLGPAVPSGYAITTPVNAHQTASSFNAAHAYLGPCPPVGATAHDYELTLHAVDQATLTALSSTSTPQQAKTEIEAHSVAKAVLVGKFAR